MSKIALPTSDFEFFAGIPVPVNPEAIEHEISRLWKPLDAGDDSQPAVTRACLSNIIFYLPDPACCQQANELVLAVGRRFPSRMILLKPAFGVSSAGGSRLSASITAVCHPGPTGGPPICCEQISLTAEDQSLDVFPGAVSPLLVPDLPVNLVLLSSEGTQLVEMLSHVVDRVIFDSRRLEARALSRAQAVVTRWPRLDIDDLAWRSTVGWRTAVHEIFEEPAARSILATTRSIEVRHVKGGSAAAAFLGGWLTSRLGRKASLTHLEADSAPGEPGQILSLRIEAGSSPGAAHLAIRRADGARRLQFEHHTEETCVIPRTIPLRVESSAELLGGALERTTHQGVLRAALQHAVG